ncbi:AI-2E family transporter [Acinetobacter larvae]|uniref:AI-2E family transporter n=1 Tax=Acinetobacter larvae TaxID=1789224 RepID=A0A1B2M1F4_9GAMM|nr:AI-2E family transporter [Acinetobacter larvae]AOA58999.1 hypothetical protein BFG52_11990 [Acinetobacter larvae]
MKILNDRQCVMVSYVLMLIFLVLLIPMHLLACFFAGFVIFEIINSLGGVLEKYIDGQRARLTISIVVSIIVLALVALAITGLYNFVLHDLQGAKRLIIEQKVDHALQGLQLQIVQYMPNFTPYSLAEIKTHVLGLLRANIATLKHTGTGLIHSIVTIIIGIVLGILISLNQLNPQQYRPVFKQAMLVRIINLSNAFRSVVFAQIKISLINTLLFVIFVFVVLPIFNVHLPFAKTLTILTFIFGLIPIVGNLVTNTLITLAGLTISLTVAIVALSYLIIIHKLEYFINAKIIGSKIHAQSWEVLLAMLIFESLFGLPGLIAAPIFYAYLKIELKQADMI